MVINGILKKVKTEIMSVNIKGSLVCMWLEEIQAPTTRNVSKNIFF